MTEKDSGISWLTKHADTLVILGVFASAYWSLNEKMNERFAVTNEKINERFDAISSDMNVRNEKINERFDAISSDMNVRFAVTNEKISNVEKELAIIKTVMILKNIMPDELCQTPEKIEKK